jgi:Mg2+-importing ATPase
VATAVVIAVTLALPGSGLGRLFGFVPLPPRFFGVLVLILIAYGITAELVKWRFYLLETERTRVVCSEPSPAGRLPDY